MITQAVIGWFFQGLNWALGLLPTWSLPSLTGWTSYIGDTRIWQWAAWANWYVPLDLAVAFLAVRLAAWTGMWTFEAVVWLLTKAHVLGGQ